MDTWQRISRDGWAPPSQTKYLGWRAIDPALSCDPPDRVIVSGQQKDVNGKTQICFLPADVSWVGHSQTTWSDKETVAPKRALGKKQINK